MKKYFLAGVTALLLAGGLVFSFNSQNKPSVEANASEFVIASYNVENFFDMQADGTEYPEYIPNFKGWTKEAHAIKLTNVAKVIKDMNAAVVALEEVENENALNDLLAKLKKDGSPYPYHAITKSEKSAVQSALISRFEILSYEELKVGNHRSERPILKARLAVGKNELIVYVNHWKAKTGPESKRVESAYTLTTDIKKLPVDADFLVLGDLNSNYNEMDTFVNDKKLNDTGGITAINHILKTVVGEKLADKANVMVQSGNEIMYNLWLELPKYDRVSEYFGKEKNTPDNIIIPKSMFDKKGISYKDGSFEVFAPPYLMKNGRPHRWQDDKGIPSGYSDHLPIVAHFQTGAFSSTEVAQPPKTSSDASALREVKISDLYSSDFGKETDILIKNVVVIYKNFDNLIIKQKNGRAVYVYNAPTDMELGGIYDIRVGKLEDYRGLKEIKQITDHKRVGADEITKYYVKNPTDLATNTLQNEIVSGVSGILSRGKFIYGDQKSIKIYFKDKKTKPKNLTKIILKSAHMGFFNEPQIIIYQASDFEVTE